MWLAIVRVVAATCTGARLTDLSGTLVSSDYSSSPLEANDQCIFRIEPAASTAESIEGILLVFEDLYVPTAELFVYQGDAVTTQNLEWSCLRCNDVLPPPARTNLDAWHITFRSPLEATAYFRVRYVAYTAQLAQGRYVVNLFMGQAWLEAPTIDARVPRGLTYEWKIAPNACETPCDLTLMVETLRLPVGDEIRVYDGLSTNNNAELAAWVGGDVDERSDDSSWIRATGETMLVVLETKQSDDDDDDDDDNSTIGAFYARIFADAQSCYLGSYCNCGEAGGADDLPLRRGPTMILSDGSSSESAMEIDDCSWLIKPHVLDDDNNDAGSDETLVWPPDSNGSSAWAPKLTLVPVRVSVKRTGGEIRVYDGDDATAPLLWDCSGCQEVAPPPLEASGAALFVRYSSDAGSAYYQDLDTGASLEWTGWRAMYWTDSYTTARGAGSSAVVLLAGSVESVRAPFVDADANSYAPDLDYRWIISPPATTVRLAFIQLDLRNCTADVLDVYLGRVDDGGDWDQAYALAGSPELLASYDCTSANPPVEWLVATSGLLTLRLKTSSVTTTTAEKTTTTTEGSLEFSYYSDAPQYRCGHVREPGLLLAPSFIFSDGSGPTDEMPSGADCTWRIAPRAARGRITLLLARVDLVGAVFEVFDGSDDAAPMLWRCAGCQEVPPVITSSGKTLFVHLETTVGASLGTGFEARYYSTGMGDRAAPLVAAAAPSIQAPTSLSANLDHYWYIDVGGAETITLAFSALDFGDDANLTVYDGSAALDEMAVFVGSTLPTAWLVSSGPTMTLRLQTGAAVSAGRFDVSYFSERAQAGCGGTLDAEATTWSGGTRTILRAPSFLFSDGSAAAEKMRAGESCDWIVSPTGLGVRQIVLRFPRLDLGTAGTLNVTDATTGRLLWRCTAACVSSPPPLVLECSNVVVDDCSMRVVYVSEAGARDNALGSGFLAHYFTATTEAPQLPNELPLLLRTHVDDGFWHLAMLPEDGSWSLRFDKTVGTLLPLEGGDSASDGETPTYRESVVVVDGNDASGQRELETSFAEHCGALLGPSRSSSNSSEVALRSNGDELPVDPRTSYLHFRTTSRQQVFFYNGTTAARAALNATSQGYGTIEVPPASACSWALEGATYDAAEASVEFLDNLALAPGVNLYIYAGSSAAGEPLLACESCVDAAAAAAAAAALAAPSSGVRAAECCAERGRVVTSTCGRIFLTLALDANETAGVRFEEAFNATSLRVSFEIGPAISVPRDLSEACWDDPSYAAPESSSSNNRPSVFVVLALGVAGAAVVASGLGFVFYARWLETRRPKVHYKMPFGQQQQQQQQQKTGMGPSPIAPQLAHARHYGAAVNAIWTALTLKKGTCSICYGEKVKVFGLAQCNHEVCRTCLSMYAKAALGDISMFPLRCPMHHAGCKTTIADALARLVLGRAEYRKFLDFSDRSVLGDGMHCLKCGCFVNLPADSAEPLVQCPYCAYRWCVRCKCPWHPGVQCDERGDVQLEEWRELQGAQRCPGCYKIIEKDDPETCNHMVHKSTDPLPCNRERTDFCYCCGIEVTPDYPHCEVDSPGTCHFPDGVFQDCRAVKLGYATMLQKRRHARRQGNNNNNNPNGRTAALVETGVIGDNAFGNFFQQQQQPARGPRRSQVAADPEGDDDDRVSPTERRRRRREQRESNARSRRVAIETESGGFSPTGQRTPTRR
ncbi:hypothetical protein CTAYLR_002490 [Chrysophaeum taylorii]|uniref:RING-type domain-containing protein n=1 Tax=Chrysophaeum taylorii TaxID=2483200 RepID=A0AAD7XJC6_9STRA|nr:hypothetical protein CTAYLR_002490 [Chrysophaeum taylorii]